MKLKRTTGERVPEMTRPSGAKGVAGQICVTSMAHFHFEVTDDDHVDLGEGEEGREQRGCLLLQSMGFLLKYKMLDWYLHFKR